MLFDTGLKFHQHASEATMKANRVLACMRRGFTNLCFYEYTSQWFYLRILEYGNVIWEPHYEAIRSMQT